MRIFQPSGSCVPTTEVDLPHRLQRIVHVPGATSYLTNFPQDLQGRASGLPGRTLALAATARDALFVNKCLGTPAFSAAFRQLPQKRLAAW